MVAMGNPEVLMAASTLSAQYSSIYLHSRRCLVRQDKNAGQASLSQQHQSKGRTLSQGWRPLRAVGSNAETPSSISADDGDVSEEMLMANIKRLRKLPFDRLAGLDDISGKAAAAVGKGADEDEAPDTADAAIAQGIAKLKGGDSQGAMERFNAALAMGPNTGERRAALYNIACCHVANGNFNAASASLMEAVKTADLNISVAKSDPDMAAFRRSPQYEQLLREVDPTFLARKIGLVILGAWVAFLAVYWGLVAAGVISK
eukprot:jgi/Mesvir1/10756/Mv13825-RA.1